MASKKHSTQDKMLKKAIELIPGLISRKKRNYKKKKQAAEIFIPLLKDILKETRQSVSPKAEEEKKIHPWRLCPIGEHWVVTHDMKTEASAKNPDGITTRQGHCRANPSSKTDILTAEEMREIARLHFKDSGRVIKWEFSGRQIFLREIEGWTQYWNEVLKPATPLDPDLVLALIGSESSFNLNPKVDKRSKDPALGVAQLLRSTIGHLKNSKGELKDHLVIMSEQEASDPAVAIGAAVRWLHHKRKLASVVRLKREATWREGVAEYKAYLKESIEKKDKKILKLKYFDDLYSQIKSGSR